MGVRRSTTALLLLAAGLAYLAYKAEYLDLDAPEGLKAFIVSPGVFLMAAAGFVAFRDARRRLGACLSALGAATALACVAERRASDGWPFYAPDPSLGGLHPSPTLVGMAAFSLGLGAALLARRPLAGGALVGLALWTLFCFSPSEQMRARRMEGMMEGMTRHDHYYFLSGTLPGPQSPMDWALPVTVGCLGAWIAFRKPAGP